MASISLNGTSFTPSGIDEAREKIGSVIAAANGSRRFAHRAHKREWTLTWTNVAATVRDAVRTIYALTTTFTYVDENSNSITVLCLPGGFQSSVSLISYEGGALTLRYTVTLKVSEA